MSNNAKLLIVLIGALLGMILLWCGNVWWGTLKPGLILICILANIMFLICWVDIIKKIRAGSFENSKARNDELFNIVIYTIVVILGDGLFVPYIFNF